MGRRYTIFISVLAIGCGLVAGGIGFWLMGDPGFTFAQKFFGNFFFTAQIMTTTWCVAALFKKEKSSGK